MTHQDEARFTRALVYLRGAMPNAPTVSTEMLQIYRAVLGDQPIEAIERAVETCMRSDSPFYPSAGQLLALCTGGTQNQAQLAWLDVVKEVRRVGYTGTPNLPEATTETVRAMFGSWRQCCEKLPAGGPEFLGFQKQFLAAYNALAERRTQVSYIGRGEAKTILGGLMKQIAAHRDRGQLPPREAGR